MRADIARARKQQKIDDARPSAWVGGGNTYEDAQEKAWELECEGWLSRGDYTIKRYKGKKSGKTFWGVFEYTDRN